MRPFQKSKYDQIKETDWLELAVKLSAMAVLAFIVAFGCFAGMVICQIVFRHH